MTKPCPSCDGKMVLRKTYSSSVFRIKRIYVEWDWWCMCGHTEDGGEVDTDTFKEWEAANAETDTGRTE